MSPQQVASLRQNNPFKYLKFLVNARNHSTDGGSNSSTASSGISSLGAQEEFLNSLKTILFNVDLITHLEVYPSDGIKIKEMLRKVNVQADSPLVLKFVAEVSTFLDQLLVN